jgi:hypothetical protein
MASLLHAKKHLKFDALRQVLSSILDNTADPRQRTECVYSVHDAMMSAFACMYFQDPSLLHFQQRLEKKYQRNNLQTIFRVKHTPKDSQLRDIIDGIPSESLAPVFKALHERLRRHKYLEDYAVLPNMLMCVIDGTQYHSSKHIHCQHCLQKQHKGDVTYSHGVLQGAIMHPDKKQVLPVMPEAIANNDGAKKQDCETKAAKRFVKKLREAHPRQQFILGGDGLMSHQPMIEIALEHNMHFLFVAKPGDHHYLFDWINAFPALPFREFKDDKQQTHQLFWQNAVPLNGKADTIEVNYIEYRQVNPHGKVTYKNSWVTDIPVTQENVFALGRAGRCRWKIENECFNSLKTQGYEIEHNYGHGQDNLSFNMYLLTLLAFYFHQIFELSDGMYQACRQYYGSKRQLWENFRSTIRLLIVEDWEQLMDLLLNEEDYEVSAVKRR